ncbi:hypothetical protein [Butyrivibrio fibrisolvens]|uniref:Uncharacterized protein n=1 Tax=Butyrivibrio fibrisolvens TaxID=831 RepID=A0A317G6W3_BUTFI|nr:hypothetical protein [Butyrivibrio fibrisolvens]PWT28473.1 hypothetical protein CPT75_15820 [Butyrivibrio fibrisolvens]
MSDFLGPIHFWLYDKIKKQEELTKKIAQLSVSEGWISDTSDYVYDLPDLETSIDEDNIHGWLQSAIGYAEGRYSDLLGTVLEGREDRLSKIKETAFEFGEENSLDEGILATDAYQVFENFFVNGMPCDHVNQITDSSADSLTWEMTQDVHAASFGSNTKDYYQIRKSVMDGMLEGTGLSLSMKDSFHYSISK